MVRSQVVSMVINQVVSTEGSTVSSMVTSTVNRVVMKNLISFFHHHIYTGGRQSEKKVSGHAEHSSGELVSQ